MSQDTDVIRATLRDNFILKLGLNFDSSSGIEQINGTDIGGILELRADSLVVQDNVWNFSNIELVNVDLINGRSGNDSIVGSMGNDVIKGDAGNDTLVGGAGLDTLSGGSSQDHFVFNSINGGVDTITDFSVRDDVLVFSAAGFGGDLVPGAMSSSMFVKGVAATTAQHRFIYDGSSGDLFYDSDGTGESEQVQLARLNSGLNLGSGNLFVGM